MRAVGLAELALELLCQRAATRHTFGKKLYQHVSKLLLSIYFHGYINLCGATCHQ